MQYCGSCEGYEAADKEGILMLEFELYDEDIKEVVYDHGFEGVRVEFNEAQCWTELTRRDLLLMLKIMDVEESEI